MTLSQYLQLNFYLSFNDVCDCGSQTMISIELFLDF